MKIEFHKYPSIENAYRQGFIDKLMERGFNERQWCITEKVHGANTQLVYNGVLDEFQYGKRTSFLTKNDNFFHIQDEIEPIKEKLKALYDYLKEKRCPLLKAVTLYGEIFGGSYPAQGVEVDHSSSRVQREVFYHPSNKWMAFDIAIDYDNDIKPDLTSGITPCRRFLSGIDFFAVCHRFDIPCVPLLELAPSLQKALEYPNDGSSVVYKEYGLPEIEGNIMEGVVIRPWLYDGFIGDDRVIIKNKNEKFKEKHSKPKEFKAEIPLSELVKKCISEASQLVNEQRLHSVMSKIGENLTARDIGRVMKAFNQDVIEDYMKDDEFSYREISADEKEWKQVTKAISTMSAEMIKKELLYK